jgi:LPXTG-site transpeptidase (sortase) family protein
MPGDPGQQSTYNERSTERSYDPSGHSPIDDYGNSDRIKITVPSLPSTGFAPNRITLLPHQPKEKAYEGLGDLWLEIPVLGVKVSIMGIPQSASGWDLTWLWDQAGYLEGTAFPTHAGNSAITAHVTLSNGQPGPFANLYTMYWGQRVIIHAYGQQYIYEVREVRRIWPGNLSVLRHEDQSWLTLLTCYEYNEQAGDYRYRIAVRAVLVKVILEDDSPPDSK